MSSLGPDVDDATKSVVEIYRRDLSAQMVEWDEARVIVEYWDGSEDSAIWSCQTLVEGELGGIFISEELGNRMNRLRRAIEESSGESVMRLRVGLGGDLFFSETRSGDGAKWEWPDEADTIVDLETPIQVIDKLDGARYQPWSGEIDEPESSLQRIHAWLRADTPGYVDMFNPPATIDGIEAVEESLGMRLPISVRDAYLAFDGQPAGSANVLMFNWLSLDSAMAELENFKSRSDLRPRLPIMVTDGIVAYVEAPDSDSGDSPIWLWEYRSSRDEKLADSFGAYLSQLADLMQAGDVVVDNETGILSHFDEIYGSMTKEEVAAEKEWEDSDG